MRSSTSMWYKLLKDEINWAEIPSWQLISTNYKLDYTNLSMLYALDHYHANMSNFPGRLSAISQVSENGSSTPLVPNLTRGFHSLERKKQLPRGSVVILLQLRS